MPVGERKAMRQGGDWEENGMRQWRWLPLFIRWDVSDMSYGHVLPHDRVPLHAPMYTNTCTVNIQNNYTGNGQRCTRPYAAPLVRVNGQRH